MGSEHFSNFFKNLILHLYEAGTLSIPSQSGGILLVQGGIPA